MGNSVPDSIAPPTGSKARARSQQKMKAKESEPTCFVSFAQAAALNGPMTRIEAAQCLLGVASAVFGPQNAERVALIIGKRMNLPEGDLLPGMAKLRPRKKADGGKSDKRVALTPYTLFLSYAMKELYKQKEDLPVIKDFLKQHGDGGKINFQTAIQIWRSLPCDKERLDVLKPFLDAINKDRLLHKQQLPGGGSGGTSSGATEPGVMACERYLQYVAEHPEASFVRLLKLDGGVDGLGAPSRPVATAPPKGTAAATGAAQVGGSSGPVTTAMDVDSPSADSGSEQEDEAEDGDEEEEEEVEVGVSGSEEEGAVQFSTPAAAMAQKVEDEEGGSQSETSSESGSEDDVSEVEEQQQQQEAHAHGSGDAGNSDGSGNSSSSESDGMSGSDSESGGGEGDEDGDEDGNRAEGPAGSQRSSDEEREAGGGGSRSSEDASGNSDSGSGSEDDRFASEDEDSSDGSDNIDGGKNAPQLTPAPVKGGAKKAAAVAAPAASPKRVAAAAAATSELLKRAKRGKA